MRSSVLVISDYGWPTGGTEEFVRALLETVGDQRPVELLTWAGSEAPVPPGIPVIEVQNGDVLRVWQAVARADLVVVVTSFNVRMLARLAEDIGRATDTPLVTVVQTAAHSTPAAAASGPQAAWLRSLITRSRAAVGASPAVSDALGELTEGTSASTQLVTIENGARLVDAHARADTRRRVLFIGRPVESKGYGAFLRAVDELSDTGLEFSANTVSIEPELSDDRVSYTSCLSDDALVQLFRDTDLVVAPYRGADGLPLALLEALNCGVPVLGFDSPAVGALLRRYGQPVIDGHSDHLVAAIKAWASGGLAFAPPPTGQVPSLAGQAGQYRDLLEDLLREGSAAHTPPARRR